MKIVIHGLSIVRVGAKVFAYGLASRGWGSSIQRFATNYLTRDTQLSAFVERLSNARFGMRKNLALAL